MDKTITFINLSSLITRKRSDRVMMNIFDFWTVGAVLGIVSILFQLGLALCLYKLKKGVEQGYYSVWAKVELSTTAPGAFILRGIVENAEMRNERVRLQDRAYARSAVLSPRERESFAQRERERARRLPAARSAVHAQYAPPSAHLDHVVLAFTL